jgi:copper(I)-binding protein
MPAAAGDDIVVKQARSRATPKATLVASGYLTIENHGAAVHGIEVSAEEVRLARFAISRLAFDAVNF